MLNTLKDLIIFKVNYHFVWKEWRLISATSLCEIFWIKNVYIKALKQELNHGLVLKTFHRVIKFTQKSWLKLYVDMNTNWEQK